MTTAETERRPIRLANGLRVWADARPGTGTVSLALALPIGARHDPPRQRGLAHLLEHLLFEGSHRWNAAQLRAEVEQRGGDLNGHTSFELTFYEIHLPARELAFGLRVLQQLVFAPVFPPDCLEKEKRIIANEAAPELWEWQWHWRSWLYRRGLYGPPRETIWRLAFRRAGLEVPVIGFARHRRRIKLETVRTYYQRWYTPGRAHLVAVGDFDVPALERLAGKILGGVAASDVDPAPVSAPRPAGPGRRHRIWMPANVSIRELAVGLPFDGAADPDQGAIQLLTRLVHAEILERLRYSLGLIYSVKPLISLFTDCGLVCLAVDAPARQTKLVEREMDAILDRLCAGEFSAEQVERVRSAWLGHCAVENQSNEEQMSDLVQDAGLLLGRAPANLAGHIAGITLADLKRTAARLLRRDNRQWAVHQPNMVLFFMGMFSSLVLFVIALVILFSQLIHLSQLVIHLLR